MKPNSHIFLLFLLLGFGATAQKLKFRLVSDGRAAMGVNVLNLVTEKTTVSDANGEFVIEAKADELLVFPSEKYEYKRYLIDADDFKKDVVVLALIAKPIELDEVIVNRDINPEDLGLVPKGQKKYTVAERRLKQAGELKPEFLLGMMAGVAIPIDPILNAISGRTKMLKKDVKTEKKEKVISKLKSVYPETYFTEKLQIPAEDVEGFRYYVADEPSLAAAIDSGAKAKIDFCLAGLAQKFNALHASEQK